MLYLHGGAFYIGGPNTHRRAVSHLVRETGQAALVVDYRQSPRFPVSSSVSDCATAFEWLIGRGYQAGDISIVGDSAGAFLSVATAITVRKRNIGNRQMHIFPVLADIVPEGMAALRRAAAYLNELHAAGPGTQPAA
jgi:acetyl esterase/lipase